MGGPRTGTVAVAESGSATPCSRPPLSSSPPLPLVLPSLFFLSSFSHDVSIIVLFLISHSPVQRKSLLFLFLPPLLSVYLRLFLLYSDSATQWLLSPSSSLAFSFPFSLRHFLGLSSVCYLSTIGISHQGEEREKEKQKKKRETRDKWSTRNETLGRGEDRLKMK